MRYLPIFLRHHLELFPLTLTFGAPLTNILRRLQVALPWYPAFWVVAMVTSASRGVVEKGVRHAFWTLEHYIYFCICNYLLYLSFFVYTSIFFKYIYIYVIISISISYIYIHKIASILHTDNFTVYVHIRMCTYISSSCFFWIVILMSTSPNSLKNVSHSNGRYGNQAAPGNSHRTALAAFALACGNNLNDETSQGNVGPSKVGLLGFPRVIPSRSRLAWNGPSG